MKFLAVFLVLFFSLTLCFPAQALTCRTLNQNKICILSIKRSAKNHWEYRAVVSINGQQKPMEIYNCRRKTKIDTQGQTQPFKTQGAGELICSLLN